MQKLYDFTKSLDRPLQSSTGKDYSVCLTYGGWSNRIIYEATTWFVRNVQPVKPAEVAQTVKRPQDRPENASKKRKVRLEKQMDVGSLLGAFR
jgi:hypothetical protein